MRRTLYSTIIVFFCVFSDTSAQFAWGANFKNDFYLRYVNPASGAESASNSSGHALLNPGFFLKGWAGGYDVSFSLEGGFIYSPFAISLKNYQGMGAIAFPVIAKVNFMGLSTFDPEPRVGFALGFGYQWYRTELYGLSSSAKELGVQRALNRVQIVQLDIGYGLRGFNVHGSIRLGNNSEIDGPTINFGVGLDFNITMLRKYTDPDF